MRKLRSDQKKPPTLLGWRINIRSVKALFDELESVYNFKFLKTIITSQDIIESAFGQMRYMNGPNDRPDAMMILYLARKMVRNQISKPVKNGNTEVGMEEFLFSLEELEDSLAEIEDEIEHDEESSTQENADEIDLLSSSDYNDINVSESASIQYVLGYCSRAIKHEKCSQNFKFQDGDNEKYIEINQHIQNKMYNSSVKMIKPSL